MKFEKKREKKKKNQMKNQGAVRAGSLQLPGKTNYLLLISLCKQWLHINREFVPEINFVFLQLFNVDSVPLFYI